jgi:hypothetical protein
MTVAPTTRRASYRQTVRERLSQTDKAIRSDRPFGPQLARLSVELPSQSRWPSGRLVGLWSAVSSSSAIRASSCRARPRALATRSATSHVGLDVPRSRPLMEVGSRFAASARASWLSPISSRRRRIARPRATCGVWLMRTPEPSMAQPSLARDHVPGSLSRVMPRDPGPCRPLRPSNSPNRPDSCRVRASGGPSPLGGGNQC